MAYVELAIVSPENNHALQGGQTARFTGELVNLPNEVLGQPLYYRWYSSLYEPKLDADNKPYYFSIEQNVQTRADQEFTWAPGIGSHAITFAVTDRPGEGKDDLQAILHGGVAGGASEGDSQRLLHVFWAVPLPPEGDLGALPANNLRLIGAAPAAWGTPKSNTTPVEFELNRDYHAYNRLRYRWEVIPDDPNARSFEYTPPADELDFGFYSTFNPAIQPTTKEKPNPLDVYVVHWRPPASDLDVLDGGYFLVLHVEDKHQPEGIGHHQDRIHVTIQP